MNVFQFAQTVEDDQWNDQVQQKEIQVRGYPSRDS